MEWEFGFWRKEGLIDDAASACFVWVGSGFAEMGKTWYMGLLSVFGELLDEDGFFLAGLVSREGRDGVCMSESEGDPRPMLEVWNITL